MNLMWENLFNKNRKSKEVRDILANNYIFESLNKRELAFIETLTHLRKYKPGEFVFRQGEVGVGMYILLSGHVDVTVEDTSLSGTGEQFYITKLGPGDFFGEIALIEENERRTANAIAHDEVALLGFFTPDLSELVERNPVAGIKVFKKLASVLGRRLKETSHKVTELKREIQIRGSN